MTSNKREKKPLQEHLVHVKASANTLFASLKNASPVSVLLSTEETKPLTQPPENDIGKRLKEAREKRGLSQEGLSRLTKTADPEGQGISRTVLTGYEKGKFKPGTRELRILYQAIGLTPNWLVLGEHDPERLREFRRQFKSEEDFFSALLESMKKLDSDSLNGVAHLVFAASSKFGDAREVMDKFVESMHDFLDTAGEITNKLDKNKKIKK